MTNIFEWHDVTHHLFADDKQCYLECRHSDVKTVEKASAVVQSTVTHGWCMSSELQFNSLKTDLALFCKTSNTWQTSKFGLQYASRLRCHPAECNCMWPRHLASQSAELRRTRQCYCHIMLLTSATFASSTSLYRTQTDWMHMWHQGSTTAMLSSLVCQSQPLHRCSMFTTPRLGSSSTSVAVNMSHLCYNDSTGFQHSGESSTNWRWCIPSTMVGIQLTCGILYTLSLTQ